MAYANSLRNFSGRLTNNSSAGNYLTLPNEVAGAPQSLMPSQSTNSTQNAFSGGIGTDVSESLLYEEIWHACAGPLVTLPRIGERDFHFPQGHIEQIVKHIQEAPFPHYVFDINSPSSSLKKQRDYADMFGKVDSWAKTRNSLRDISPDAVILVQKLDEDISPESEEHVLCNGNGRQSSDQQGRTAVWGLVIQGRSVGVSACYILKTTQIVSTIGYCTSFCLTRAKCFGPTLHIHFQESWLLSSVA